MFECIVNKSSVIFLCRPNSGIQYQHIIDLPIVHVGLDTCTNCEECPPFVLENSCMQQGLYLILIDIFYSYSGYTLCNNTFNTWRAKQENKRKINKEHRACFVLSCANRKWNRQYTKNTNK